jgi:AcrR family transcriptional regulator
MPQRKPPQPTAARRRRLPAEQSRARILAAAERKLAEVGPERLKLTELAAELGISHPAILHHFGSREDLVGAVLAQAIARINDRLAEAMTGRSAQPPDTMLEMLAEYYGAEGRVRLLAWLMLSERAPQVHAQTKAARPLLPLVELLHAQRKKAAAPGRKVELADSKFLCQLTGFALLGEALFGDLVRLAFGEEGNNAAVSRDFWRRFAKLLSNDR